jgi:GT2 family glycosyltransferase
MAFLVDSASRGRRPSVPVDLSHVSGPPIETVPSMDDASNRLRLSKSLHLIREIVRERFPRCELKQNYAQGLAVEALLAIDETSFYIEGWMCDVESPLIRLTGVSPEGERVELLHRLVRYSRPDVQDYYRRSIGQIDTGYGFLAYFETRTPSRLASGWVVEMEGLSGEAMEEPAPTAIGDVPGIRERVLNDQDHDRAPNQQLRKNHISPALWKLQDRCNRSVTVTTTQYGDRPSDPLVSIVIPLYGRVDFLEHQLAQFVHDAEICSSDLIYVLDSPEMAKDLSGYAERLFRLYQVPFRVVALSRSVGFATANNIGSAQARGRLLLLLNSDVIPDRPGWLSKLAGFYDSLARPGAVGAKLIYEDDSLQHAGLYFDRPVGSKTWSNEHYYKGLHRDLPAANIARQVPAVTAACLMIETRLFRVTGGLSGKYVQGDYEDSDLCLRLHVGGRENWYFPGSALYHLEGQSYATAERRLNRQYNQWLFNEAWADVIQGFGESFLESTVRPDPEVSRSIEIVAPIEVLPSIELSVPAIRKGKSRNGTGTKTGDSPVVVSQS